MSKIGQLIHNQDIPGHWMMKPTLLYESAIKYFISPLGNGVLRVVSEIVKRVFLSLYLILSSIPTALTLLLAIPANLISFKICKRLPAADTEYKRILTKQETRKVAIDSDGNCALNAFIQAQGLEMDVAQLRKDTATWMTKHYQDDRVLYKLVGQSLYDQLERQSEENNKDIASHLASQSNTEDPQLQQDFQQAIDRLAEDNSLSEETLNSVKSQLGLDDPRYDEALLQMHLKDIADNDDNNRVFANGAHYYALSKMYDVNIIIYSERKDGDGYQPYERFDANSSNRPIIRFLKHPAAHIDLLVVNP